MLVVVGWCLLAVTACAAVIVDSLLPDAPHLPALVWIIPFVSLLPAGAAVLTKIVLRTNGALRTAFSGLLDAMPDPIATVLALAFIAAFVSFIVMFAVDAKGEPEATANGYQANSHGKLTPLTEHEYHHQLAAEYRAFAAGGALFNSLACGGALALRRLDRNEARPQES